MPLDAAPSNLKHQGGVRQFARVVTPTGVERHLGDNELIVSKTDAKGVITYANAAFMRIAELTEEEALGAPHSIIRHPDMPRGVFKLLWDRIAAGHEVFAYVVNLARNGDHYWVLAHVTPTYAADGRISGYHSNRRRPSRDAVDAVVSLYAQLRQIEAAAPSKAQAADASLAHMAVLLDEKGLSYDEFVFTL